MFTKPELTNPPVPYKVMVQLADFAPAKYAHDLYQDIAAHYKGLEFFQDDTSFVNVYFSTKSPDLKLFRINIDWVEYVVNRKVTITNLDAVADLVYEHLVTDQDDGTLARFGQDLRAAYYIYLLKVFLVMELEAFLSDLTQLPCYSDYTWLKQDNAQGAEELDVDRIYVVYE